MRTPFSQPRFRQARRILGICLLIASTAASALAQTAATPAAKGATASPAAASADVPADYAVGPEDVLFVNFWKDPEMTGDVTVRPDGRITIPLLGDIEAAGLSPTQLSDVILEKAKKQFKDPTVTVVVKTINSRKVYITGQVANPGAFPLTGPRTVMQLIALAGGLTEYADKKNITINRTEHGKAVSVKFNYNDVAKGKNLSQNIVLKPGDTVLVP
jgi:polysaccharide export outer membrane protein